ncbi:conserved hypothetical protein [Prochlorococcus marinus subsp. pastoris str. CCMP1986]|uniref:O-antigen ligase-related domain-containing protein n=1 Tax=Prochlorococcus marinus subsp. pastoris (strain CCMP1986 / NIES-2087 / MED4) TaxID=59919 RepID=Q7V0Q9_PROMP|nr:O-antigen ligase family protein [Prochlorococcus marinus]KGF87243.1 hypothetical protein PROCH_0831 [Prochlorococcus marinus str. EQPAC1]CAE19656.1 conserved hypothetical protein [Prochlorococcus marinus subsp. pastoris str. CCMP1986]
MNFNFIPRIEFKELFVKSNKNLNGINYFRIGVFLLPSAFSVSSIFLIIALIINTKSEKINYFKDYFNYPLFLSGILILITAISNYLSNSQIADMRFENRIQFLLDIANWIPFFYVFSSFGNYLSNTKLRKEFSILLISGSLPIFVSGFYQFFLFKFNMPFSLSGPYKLFNGLITWYQYVIQPTGELGVTSIFNNPNYLGCWLLILLPFSMFLSIQKYEKRYQKIFALSFLISIVILIALSKSRAALGLLALSIPATFELNLLITTLFLIFYLSTNLLIIFFANTDYQSSIKQLIPEQIINDFSQSKLLGNPSRELRSDIWSSAINFIKLKPLFGIGAGLFPLVYISRNELTEEVNNWVGHTHNLFLELAFNYGLILASVISFFILFLIIKSFFVIRFNKLKACNSINNFNRAWWAATILLVSSQLVDVQYYDGRISIVFWILLSGLRAIIKEG